MTHKHLTTILSIALFFSSTAHAAESTKAAKIKKSAAIFLSGAGASLLLNAATYLAGAALLNNNNPYYLGSLCVGAAAVTGLAGQKIAEFTKGEELTAKEGVQQNVADFFANIVGGALLTSMAPDSAARNLFLCVSAAKLAQIFWWVGQMPESQGTGLEEEIPNTMPDAQTTIIEQAPQEIQVVVQAPKPATPSTQTSTTSSSESSNFSWMGGDKPNHQDAFMLLGN